MVSGLGAVVLHVSRKPGLGLCVAQAPFLGEATSADPLFFCWPRLPSTVFYMVCVDPITWGFILICYAKATFFFFFMIFDLFRLVPDGF